MIKLNMKTHIDIQDLRELTKEKLDRVIGLFTDQSYDIDEIYDFIHEDESKSEEYLRKHENVEAFCQSINVSSMLNLIHEFDHDFKLQYSGKRWIIDSGKYIQEESKQVVYAYWKAILKIADIVHEEGKKAFVREQFFYTPRNNEIKHHVTMEDLTKIRNYGLDRVLEVFINESDHVEIARRSITSEKYRLEDEDSWTKEEIEEFCKKINATAVVEKLGIYDQDIRIQKLDDKWHVRAGNFKHRTENLIDALFRTLVKIADNTNTYSKLPKREFKNIKERINENLENNFEIHPHLLETYNNFLHQTNINEILEEAKKEPEDERKAEKENKKKGLGELIIGLFKNNDNKSDKKSDTEKNNEINIRETSESEKFYREYIDMVIETKEGELNQKTYPEIEKLDNKSIKLEDITLEIKDEGEKGW